jgi:hypothetical protein
LDLGKASLVVPVISDNVEALQDSTGCTISFLFYIFLLGYIHCTGGCMFSLICGRQSQKINIYTKTSMTMYKLVCRTCL